MILTILVIALAVIFAATMVWFATHREGNSMDNTPDGSQANPPVNGRDHADVSVYPWPEAQT